MCLKIYGIFVLYKSSLIRKKRGFICEFWHAIIIYTYGSKKYLHTPLFPNKAFFFFINCYIISFAQRQMFVIIE